MRYPKRSQYRYTKSPYRIRNWPEYEAGLRRRGDLTLWLSDEAIKSWWANGWRCNSRAGFSTRGPVSECPTATEWCDSHLRNGKPVLSSEPCNNAYRGR